MPGHRLLREDVAVNRTGQRIYKETSYLADALRPGPLSSCPFADENDLQQVPVDQVLHAGV